MKPEHCSVKQRKRYSYSPPRYSEALHLFSFIKCFIASEAVDITSGVDKRSVLDQLASHT